MENDSTTQPLIRGPKLSPTGNMRLFYATSCGVATILLLLLIITSYTGYTVSTVHKVATNTQDLIDDIHEFLPTVRLGLEVVKMFCNDKNFTKVNNWTIPYCDQL